jgi:MFS family permease
MINATYRKFLSAYFLSSIGDWLYKLALPIFLYQKTGSAMVMAVTYGLTFLPFVLVTPFGGVIADRLSRKQMLVRGDTASFILTLLLGLLIFFHTTQFWLLYVLVFLISAVNSLYHPVFQSIIPEIVDKKNLSKANSFISSSENMILLLGPASSGLVIGLLGPIAAIFVNALSFLISAVLLNKMEVKAQLSSSKGISFQSIMSDLKQGFVFSYQNPIVKFGCLLFIFANFGVQIILANLMFYLTNNLKLSSLSIGLTFALIGVGAILGSLIAPRLAKKITEGRLILLACLGEGLGASLLLIMHNWIGVGIAWGLVSGCISIVVVTYFTLRQKIIPNNYLGRVIAITRLISYCAIPIASIFGGWLLKNHYAFSDLVLIGSLVMILNGLLGWLTPLNQKNISESAKKAEDI